VKKVIGIEMVEDAIEDAKKNAELNGLFTFHLSPFSSTLLQFQNPLQRYPERGVSLQQSGRYH